jgi:hypothetical protein
MMFDDEDDGYEDEYRMRARQRLGRQMEGRHRAMAMPMLRYATRTRYQGGLFEESEDEYDEYEEYDADFEDDDAYEDCYSRRPPILHWWEGY